MTLLTSAILCRSGGFEGTVESYDRNTASLDFGRNRASAHLDLAQASAFGACRARTGGVSIVRSASVPIKIGERKLGWRAGDLIDEALGARAISAT